MPGRFRLSAAVLALLAAAVVVAATYEEARERMVAQIAQGARETASWTGRRAFDERVLEAMGRVPRHLFVEPSRAGEAYENRPLPIGHGQTISQPYIVALMTDLLDPEPGQVALEIGTGSGYQAAILAELGLRVYTVEIIEPLALRARQRLEALGYAGVTTRWADGYDGWPEHAPYDAIVVTAAADHIPPPLIAQLKPGGRMVIPVGASFVTQELVLVEKLDRDRIRTRQLLPVAFVPLTRLP